MLINIYIDNLGVQGSKKVCRALEIPVHIWKLLGQSGRCYLEGERRNAALSGRDAFLGSEYCPIRVRMLYKQCIMKNVCF